MNDIFLFRISGVCSNSIRKLEIVIIHIYIALFIEVTQSAVDVYNAKH